MERENHATRAGWTRQRTPRAAGRLSRHYYCSFPVWGSWWVGPTPNDPKLGTALLSEVFAVTATIKLNWCVPSAEWDAFRDHVQEEHGETEGLLGREAERAMREFIDVDEFAAVEERLDELVRAAGRTPANRREQKTSVTEDGPTTRARARVSAEVKEAFAAYAKSETDEQPGIVLARALRERRDGGRSGRMLRKFSRVGADAEALLAELNPDTDAADSMSIIEKRTVVICHRLGKQFTRADLEDAIANVAGESKPTIEQYAERVVDRLGYTTHPENEDLFIPATEHEELVRRVDEECKREAERQAEALFGRPERATTDGGMGQS